MIRLIRIHQIKMSYSMQKYTVLVLYVDLNFLILIPFEMSMKKVSLVCSFPFS
jgi:hypothetical protein